MPTTRRTAEDSRSVAGCGVRAVPPLSYPESLTQKEEAMAQLFNPSTGKDTLIDDIDGSEAAETLRYSLDGIHYEIDLSAEHADTIRSYLQPYIDASRIVGYDDVP